MKNIVYIILAVTLLVACSKSECLLGDGNEHKDTIILKVRSNVLSETVRSSEPGDNVLNENKIKNLYVFYFSHNAADNVACIESEYIDGLSFEGIGVLSMQLSTLVSNFELGEIYDIYTIANLPSDIVIPDNITLGDIKSLHTQIPITSTSRQYDFIMDGKSSAVLRPANLVSVVEVDMPLKRAMSKIRVKLALHPNSDVVNATRAYVSLRNFAARGSLLGEHPYVLTQRDYNNSSYITSKPSTIFTFYCYENNWGTTSKAETYLMVNLPHPTQSSNYYRVPINKYANSAESGRIERNMIYDVVVYIDKNGTESEKGLVMAESNYKIIDWTTNDIVFETINQHYLSINEDEIVMPNTSTFKLNYASDLPISIINISATSIEYDSSGEASEEEYDDDDPEFPEFIINRQTSTITINSEIPINYVPKNISFTVTNKRGLSLSASVIQYPTRYVTSRLSTGNIKPEWYQGGKNRNLITVNTLVPSADGSYILGDPTNGFALTDSTANGNRIVSPQFIVASQYAIYPSVSYADAQKRCLEYGEDIYRSGWRLPTKAEIEIVNNIQDDPNSAVEGLLEGGAYWSAFKYDYYNFDGNKWESTSMWGRAYVRAVYDLYKYE